jgi:hypothetical protein
MKAFRPFTFGLRVCKKNKCKYYHVLAIEKNKIRKLCHSRLSGILLRRLFQKDSGQAGMTEKKSLNPGFNENTTPLVSSYFFIASILESAAAQSIFLKKASI